jgi:dTDP-4-amino-4,6-dideoxygalactose transaminase
MQVNFVDLGAQYLTLREEILEKFDAVSRTGNYVLGPDVAEFEKNFAAYCGVKHAISMGNGSDALHLPLLCLGIGPGHEVIAPVNSFVATAWAIARTGAKIVFVDVRDDYNLDPALVKKAITPRTRAIMPVHLTGRVCDMESIMALADEHGLAVVEDAAQAAGATRGGRKAGSLGHVAGFSLHPLKNLHVHGDGGIAVTNDTALCERLQKYRNHGLRNRDECEFWGINTRLDTIQAAIANIKLKYLDRWNQRFREIAHRYTRELADVAGVPREQGNEQPIYHRYVITHPQRDQLAAFLKANGIDTRVNYPIPLHLQEAARDLGHQPGDFPVAERLARTILSLPIYPELPDKAVDYVIAKVREFKP